MAFVRAFLVLALMLPGVAMGQVNGAGPNAPVVATGGTMARTAAARAADAMSLKEFAKVDGQRVTTSVTVSGQSLSVGSAIFTPSDVGKMIVVPGAGAINTNGPVVSVPILSAGSGYSSTPIVTITGSGGSGASASAQLGAVGCTASSGGSGYSVGDTVGVTGTGSGGVLSTPIVCTVSSVNSGAITGLTVSQAGNYSVPFTSAVSPAYTSGAGTGAMVSVAWGVSNVSIATPGSSYPVSATTATLSGGSPSSAATLGPVIVASGAAPLTTTISSVTDSQHVTLANSAPTALRLLILNRVVS